MGKAVYLSYEHFFSWSIYCKLNIFFYQISIPRYQILVWHDGMACRGLMTSAETASVVPLPTCPQNASSRRTGCQTPNMTSTGRPLHQYTCVCVCVLPVCLLISSTPCLVICWSHHLVPNKWMNESFHVYLNDVSMIVGDLCVRFWYLFISTCATVSPSSSGGSSHRRNRTKVSYITHRLDLWTWSTGSFYLTLSCVLLSFSSEFYLRILPVYSFQWHH